MTGQVMKTLRTYAFGPLAMVVVAFVLSWTLVPQNVCLRELFHSGCCCATHGAQAEVKPAGPSCCSKTAPAKQNPADKPCDKCFTSDTHNSAIPRAELPDLTPVMVAVLPHAFAAADLLPALTEAPQFTRNHTGLAPPPPLILRI
ncbi:hypothetical protein CVU37_00905 [candidate division BRC1 bacterium HGW-BRC1-1]|jgi:hypothetical protein|nr:MAG: hypothetical protein CVU37_00905 [candidate division BRC1 bacterium HGW-BRC1-1]